MRQSAPQHELLRRRPTATVSAPRQSRRRSGSLLVGRVDDPAEHAADAFADDIVASLHDRPTPLFRSSVPGTDELGGVPVGEEVHAGIEAARHGGAPVPARIRRAVAHNGGDVGHVRIHTGLAAGTLSRSLQATAFTVGRDVFLGDDAPRPGTVAGDGLLAHELGHALDVGETTIHRRFGSKKPKSGEAVTTAEGKVELANGLSKNDKAERRGGRDAGKDRLKELRTEIGLLETALRRLAKGRSSGQWWDAAEALGDKAQAILASLPAADNKKAQALLGVSLPNERRRLDRIVAETELILDERRVAETKRAAEGVYMDAGRNAGNGADGFAKLSPKAQKGGFDDVPAPDPEEGPSKAEVIRAAGADLGLSPAEIAAIYTFTAQDYKYINPATANNDAWMKAANANLIDKPNLDDQEKEQLKNTFKEAKFGNARERSNERKEDLKARKEEGALHAGMAMQGLAKLPVWTGPGYRGEALRKTDFDAKFTEITGKATAPGAPRRFKATETTFTRAAIASVSKDLNVAKTFIGNAAGAAQIKTPQRYGVVYVLELNNGRDIEMISDVTQEREVVTLPGATFKVTKIESQGAVPGTGIVYVFCKQVK